jgi:single-strand DNA-binding protein
MNSVNLMGTLGADVEVNETSGEYKILKMRLATNSNKKVDGEYQQVAQWHSVVYFTKSDKIAQYLTKGQKVALTGEIEYREHEGKYYTNIVARNVELCGAKPQGSTSPAPKKENSDVTTDLPF